MTRRSVSIEFPLKSAFAGRRQSQAAIYADIKIQSRILQHGNKIAETSASEALSQAPFWRYSSSRLSKDVTRQTFKRITGSVPLFKQIAG
jgi:hypothetical protein